MRLHFTILCFVLISLGPAALIAQVIPIEGRVLTAADKTPVEGAQAELLPRLTVYESWRRELDGEASPEAVDTAVSDADGVFFLHAPDLGPWRVVVSAPGSFRYAFDLDAMATHAVLPNLYADPVDEIYVRTFDGAGKPLGDVELEILQGLSRNPWRMYWQWLGDRRRSDSRGYAVMERPVDMVVKVSSLVPYRSHGHFLRGGEREIDLEVAADRQGVVEIREPEGKAVAGAIVADDDERPFGRTDANGRARVVWPPRGDPRFQVLTSEGRHHESNRTPFSEDENVVFELPPVTFVEGRVTDAESGTPLSGALVVVNGPVGFVRTDDLGVYRFVAPERYRPSLTFAAAGYQPLEYQPAELAEGKMQPVQELQPAAVTAGVVVDGDGLPVRGAELRILELKQLVHASPEGRFHLLHPRTRNRMLVSVPGFAVADLSIGPHSNPDMRIVLDPGQRVLGWVVDPEGTPVSGAELKLYPVDFFAPKREFFDFSIFEEGYEVKWERPLEALTFAATGDADGRFVIPAVYAGHFDLALRRDGFVRRSMLGVEVTGEADVDLGDVVLEPGVSVTGRVIDDLGAPIANAKLWVDDWEPLWIDVDKREGKSPLSTHTDAEGRFHLSHLRRGSRLSLLPSHPQHLPLERGVDVHPPAEDLTLVLKRGARVRGRVVDESGQGVAWAVVSGRYSSDERGFFDILFDPGEIRLQAQTRPTDTEKVSKPLFIKIAPGEEMDGLELVVLPQEQAPADGIVEGRVTNREGEPLKDVVVGVGDEDSRLTGSTDPLGHYQIPGVPPGLWSVSVKTTPPTGREIEVLVGSNVVDFVLTSFAIEGRVTDPAGTPLPGAWMRAYGSMLTTTSSTDGTFRFAPLIAGTYDIVTELRGFAQNHYKVMIGDTDVERLEIVLAPAIRLRGQILNVDPADLPRVHVTAFSPSEIRQVEGRYDLNGAYVVEGLAPGLWTVTAWFDNGGVVSETLDLEPGSGDTTFDIDFAQASTGE